MIEQIISGRAPIIVSVPPPKPNSLPKAPSIQSATKKMIPGIKILLKNPLAHLFAFASDVFNSQ